MVADVAQRTEVERMVAAAADRFGGLDVMVANAGVGLTRPFLETTEEDLDRIVAVNLKGVFCCGQTAACAMIASETRGVIINTASIFAESCEPNVAAYCASKAGVRMLTKAVALEPGRYGIRVNAVAPGFIHTGMNPLVEPARNTYFRPRSRSVASGCPTMSPP